MTSDAATPSPSADKFRYLHTANFSGLLAELGLSLVVTTYQAGKLMVIRSGGDKLSLLLRSLERPMGLCIPPGQDEILVGTRTTVWRFRAAHDIAPQLEPKGRHDACFVPREAHVTGDMQGHEIVRTGDGRVWIVNTLFCCLCTFDDPSYSFVPQWRPPFVDRLAAEDRCHLNGIAVEDGELAFATAMGATNTADGWRENKVSGGILMTVPGGEIVSEGMCMPHSPRVYRGQLYVLDSGRGHLCAVDRATGQRTVVAAVPGYARGLAFHDRYAFVGLSQIREKKTFGGLPIAEQYGDDERRCGVWVVDLDSGETVAWLHFEAGTTEIFDIGVLDGLRWPSVIGFQGPTLGQVMVAPPEAWRA